MASVDIELELQVLRVNVGGIIGDVREAKARAARLRRSRALLDAGVSKPDARYERLQEHIRRIEERLAALELRCYCRSVGAAGKAPSTFG